MIDLLSVGVIASKLGVEVHRVEYAIRSRKIRAGMKAGNTLIYDNKQFEAIKGALVSIDEHPSNNGRRP